MKLTVRAARARTSVEKRPRRGVRGFSLVEMLVVLSLIATIASVVTFAVLRTLDGQQEKQCLENMVLIESAKDEYARDHVGATEVDVAEFRRYFRFGVPHCPRSPNTDYVNWSDLNATVTCPLHPQNATRLNPR